MKKEVCLKILTISLIVLMMVAMSTSVFAAKDYLNPKSIVAKDSAAANSTQNIMGLVLGVVQAIAAGVAVIMLVVIGIKYVAAAPSEKADLKKSLITYVVGAILLFAGSGILQVVKTFAVQLK